MDNFNCIDLFSNDKNTISVVQNSEEIFLRKIFTEFNELIKELDANQNDEGILIIDITLNEINGMATLSHLGLYFPNLRKIVITKSKTKKFALDSIKNGVKAIIDNADIEKELKKAALKVSQNKVHFEDRINIIMADELERRARKSKQNRLRKKNKKTISD